MKLINNALEIIDPYKLIIIDLFGVIHDGDVAFPTSIATVKAIRESGKKICFLSNAPRRAENTKKKLAEFNINFSIDYDYILTSGEYAYHVFKAKEKAQNILKYYYFGPEKDRDLLEGSKHIETSAEEADIAIATGLEPHQKIDDFAAEIALSKKFNLKLYCINPDKFVLKAGDKSHFCSGLIAKEYIKLGGKVRPLHNRILCFDFC